jgi:membrane complex biogenesis BtpA family protein
VLSRTEFADLLAPRAILGMVHLRPLPGAPLYAGSLDAVIDDALTDARALSDGGVDALVFENFGDRPFFRGRVGAETVAAMTRVIADVMHGLRLPFGVNVLRNDAASALAIAAATGATFIRINVHVGSMLTDQGLIEGEAASTLRMRATIAPRVAIFADHFVKHAVPLGDVDPVQAAKDLRLRGLADAIVVSGMETGAAPDADRLRALREATDAPLLIGSGLTEENARGYDADGAFVGTSIKRNGRVDEAVDRARVERIVAAFRERDGR